MYVISISDKVRDTANTTVDLLPTSIIEENTKVQLEVSKNKDVVSLPRSPRWANAPSPSF